MWTIDLRFCCCCVELLLDFLHDFRQRQAMRIFHVSLFYRSLYGINGSAIHGNLYSLASFFISTWNQYIIWNKVKVSLSTILSFSTVNVGVILAAQLSVCVVYPLKVRIYKGHLVLWSRILRALPKKRGAPAPFHKFTLEPGNPNILNFGWKWWNYTLSKLDYDNNLHYEK